MKTQLRILCLSLVLCCPGAVLADNAKIRICVSVCNALTALFQDEAARAIDKDPAEVAAVALATVLGDLQQFPVADVLSAEDIAWMNNFITTALTTTLQLMYLAKFDKYQLATIPHLVNIFLHNVAIYTGSEP